MIQTKTERFEMRLEPEILDRVDDWRRKNEDDLPSRSEAIRRLIEIALSTGESPRDPKFSDGEKLTLMMLCDIAEKLGVKENVDPDLVRTAMIGGHYWALRWGNSFLFHDNRDSPEMLRETLDILDMWDFLEEGFRRLSDEEKQHVKDNAWVPGDTIRFRGFDGNHETEYMGIAAVLTEKLDRFSRLKGRANLNSHMPTIGGYRRMLGAFLPIRATLTGGELNAAQIITVMNAWPHPDSPAAEARKRKRTLM
jgi:uncharacterized protein YfbU (UPF0304 family)